ncbi:hypothetical protein GH714_029508 [Hevea brasiliensis]|uniref:NAB domain-containing protein n=1 Tax=Hevea brasiliensis TaxID=3981 RepID=A0A6A6LNW3_HEVBR|nr:hypothetical protein GH714_029508 [Hevea brasiliensis]
MENNGASCSSTPDNHDCPQQSQWLQLTLSDSNKRIKAMMTLLEEDDNTSTRDEIHCKRRVKLFQMLEGFNNSYRSLAEKYDKLRSESCHENNPGSIPSACSDTNEKTRLIPSSTNSELKLFDSYLDSILEDPDADCDNTDFNFEYLNKLVEKLMSTEPHAQSMEMKMKLDSRENHCNEGAKDLCDQNGVNVKMDDSNSVQNQATVRDLSENSYEQANRWSELKFQVTKLMEENLKQQVELARRNIQKRVVINRLQSELEHLKGENRALQNCINCLKVGEKPNQFQTSKLKRIFSSKFF